MRFLDLASYSFSHLKHRGIRTWLTLLGIVIGISSVILLVGIADGMSQQVSESLSGFGADIMTISGGSTAMRGGPGGPTDTSTSSGKLLYEDLKTVERVDGVREASATLSVKVEVKYKKDTAEKTITGVDTGSYLETGTLGDIAEGRYLEKGDTRVALIGGRVAESAFGKPVGVNSVLELDGQKYRVVGVLESAGTGFSAGDNSIMVPLGDAEDLAGDSIAEGEISSISVKVAEGYNVSAVEDKLEWALMKSRGVTENDKDFSIMSSQAMQESITEMLGTLTLFLGVVSGVSLIVGGIGISNTMFMSVLERTREIGVLKSIGATSGQIRNLFLMEAAMIGIAGGMGGLAVGWAFIQFIATFGYPGVISPFMTAFAVVFSAAVGIVAGTYPAKEAAKVPAIVALRYE